MPINTNGPNIDLLDTYNTLRNQEPHLTILPRLIFPYESGQFPWVGINPSFQGPELKNNFLAFMNKHQDYLHVNSNDNFHDDITQHPTYYACTAEMGIDHINFRIFMEFDERYVQRDVKVSHSDFFGKPRALFQRKHQRIEDINHFQNIDLFPIRETQQVNVVDLLAQHIELRDTFIRIFLQTLFLLSPRIVIIGNKVASKLLRDYLEENEDYTLVIDELGLDHIEHDNRSIPIVFFQIHTYVSPFVWEILYRLIIQNL